MTYRLNAQGMLRAIRNGLARLNVLLVETGSSDEDLVFRLHHSEVDRPLSDRELRDFILCRLDEAPARQAERPN